MQVSKIITMISITKHSNGLYRIIRRYASCLTMSWTPYVRFGWPMHCAREANVASSELTSDGNLRISCNRGLFSSKEATRRGAYNMAIVVDEIQQDILATFQRPDHSEKAPKATHDIRILIENTDDNLEFAELVLEKLR